MKDFALSTAWNAFRHRDGSSVIEEIKNIGFDKVELSFNLTNPMVCDVYRLVDENRIKIISLHNFCPIPYGLRQEDALPDSYSLAAEDSRERRLAVDFTKRTIDAAYRLGAKVVILHCGRVEITDRTKELISLFNQGLTLTREYQNLKEQAIQERREGAPLYFQNLLGSLEKLDKYAKESKVLLGIETRFYYNEIPTFEELGIILDEFKNSSIFYWHDVGHAQVQENLAFAKHEDYLRSFSQNMIGLHLHNIMGCLDHRAPTQGEFDFKKLKTYVKNGQLLVIEAHSPATGEDLKQSRIYLESIFNE